VAVRVEGLNELIRAFGKVDKDLKRGVQRELQASADIVSQATKSKIGSLSPPGSSRTIGGVRPRVRGSTAVVEQRLGKTTGKRGDWGVTQMHRGFLPALSEKTTEVVQRLDEMLGRLAGEF